MGRRKQEDAATGQYFLRARCYQPGLGWFMARDQWAYDFQNPVAFNRYGYTANNPVNSIDPSCNEGYWGLFFILSGGYGGDISLAKTPKSIFLLGT
jgi:RHS repeat-associated protein